MSVHAGPFRITLPLAVNVYRKEWKPDAEQPTFMHHLPKQTIWQVVLPPSEEGSEQAEVTALDFEATLVHVPAGFLSSLPVLELWGQAAFVTCLEAMYPGSFDFEAMYDRPEAEAPATAPRAVPRDDEVIPNVITPATPLPQDLAPQASFEIVVRKMRSDEHADWTMGQAKRLQQCMADLPPGLDNAALVSLMLDRWHGRAPLPDHPRPEKFGKGGFDFGEIDF